MSGGGLGAEFVLIKVRQVFKDAFDFDLVSPPPRGSGGGSALSLSKGIRGFGADAGPEPGVNLFYFDFQEQLGLGS